MINFVEIELGGDSWTISWAGSREGVCTGEKFGRRYASYNYRELTPSTAFDSAMTQLSWLREKTETKGFSKCFKFKTNKNKIIMNNY